VSAFAPSRTHGRRRSRSVPLWRHLQADAEPSVSLKRIAGAPARDATRGRDRAKLATANPHRQRWRHVNPTLTSPFAYAIAREGSAVDECRRAIAHARAAAAFGRCPSPAPGHNATGGGAHRLNATAATNTFPIAAVDERNAVRNAADRKLAPPPERDPGRGIAAANTRSDAKRRSSDPPIGRRPPIAIPRSIPAFVSTAHRVSQSLTAMPPCARRSTSGGGRHRTTSSKPYDCGFPASVYAPHARQDAAMRRLRTTAPRAADPSTTPARLPLLALVRHPERQRTSRSIAVRAPLAAHSIGPRGRTGRSTMTTVTAANPSRGSVGEASIHVAGQFATVARRETECSSLSTHRPEARSASATSAYRARDSPSICTASTTAVCDLIPRPQRAGHIVLHEAARGEDVPGVLVARIARERLLGERRRVAPPAHGRTARPASSAAGGRSGHCDRTALKIASASVTPRRCTSSIAVGEPLIAGGFSNIAGRPEGRPYFTSGGNTVRRWHDDQRPEFPAACSDASAPAPSDAATVPTRGSCTTKRSASAPMMTT